MTYCLGMRVSSFRSTAMVLILSAGLSSPAAAQVRGVIDTSLRGAAGSDPIDAGREGGALSAGIQVDPSIYYEGEATTVTLRGSASVDWYTGWRETSSALSASAGVTHRLDRKTTLGVNTSVSSTRSAVQDFLRNIGPVERADFVGRNTPIGGSGVPGGIDGGLAGDPFSGDFLEAYRGRVTTLGVDASLTRALSPRDALSVALGVRSTDSEDVATSDFRVVTGSLAYRRRLSERASLNASAVGGRADYSNRALIGGGNSTYLTPMLSLSLQLSEAITATAGAGVSLVRRAIPGTPQEPTRVSFAGQLDICQRLDRGSLCLNANRAAQPTAFAGVATVSAVNLSLSKEFGENSSVGLSAALTKRDGGQDPRFPPDQTQEIVAITGHYSRKLGERMTAFVSPGYSKITGGAFGGRDNAQVSVGIRYRFGN